MSAMPSCPGVDCWRALLAGDLAPDEREQFERHLESCLVCQVYLDRAADGGDDLLGLARRLGAAPAPSDPTLTGVLERLHGLRPPT
jgi:hypothetical protein